MNATQNSARFRVTPNSVTGPDSPHRIGTNDTTLATESMAPNTSMLDEPTMGVLGLAPTPVVKTSTSCWMRWSGLSVSVSVNRAR